MANEQRSFADMDFDKAVSVLESANNLSINGNHFIRVELQGNGEPLLYSDITRFVIEAKKMVPYVAIITNGFLLDENKIVKFLNAGLDRITISITGVASDVYSKFQGSGISQEQCEKNLERVLNNVKLLARKKMELGKKTFIVVRFIKTNESEAHLKEYIKFWSLVNGVDAVQITNIYDFHKQKGIIRRCVFAPRGILVYANGRVRPCNCGFDSSDVGNINENTLNQIFASDKYKIELKNRTGCNEKKLPKTCLSCEHRRSSPLMESIKYQRQWIYLHKPFKNILYKPYGFAVIVLQYLFRIRFFYNIFLFCLRVQSIVERNKFKRQVSNG
jgi:radical SAM protein with 4Fe4S-binding SPASM domain